MLKKYLKLFYSFHNHIYISSINGHFFFLQKKLLLISQPLILSSLSLCRLLYFLTVYTYIYLYYIANIEFCQVLFLANKKSASCFGHAPLALKLKKEKKGKDLYNYHSGKYSPLPLFASETRSIAVTFAYGNCG